MGEASRTLTQDTQLFHDVFNASSIGIAVENLEGQPLFVNPSFCSFLGFSEEELRNKHCVDFSPREDAEKDWALFQQLRAGSIDHYQLEKRYFRRDGSLVWGSLSISLLKSSPSPLVLAMVEDITDKKKAEEARYRYAAVVESSEDAIISKNLDGIIVSWNAGAERIYGYMQAEAVGKPISILVPPELVDDQNRILKSLRAGERIEHYETVRVTKEGKRINVSLSLAPIKDTSGAIVELSGIARDITERKLAEQELATAMERLHLAIESGSVGGWDYNLKTGKKVWFGETHAQLGMAPDEAPGSFEESWNRIHKDDREHLQHALRVARDKHEQFTEEFRVVWRDGTTRWIRSRGRFFYAANGEPERLLGLSVDITERKLAEESLLASEERLRSAQWAARIGTFEWNIRTGVSTRTPELEALYGVPPGSFGKTHEDFLNLVHPDDRARVVKLVEGSLETEQPIEGEWRTIWPDGSVHWIAARWQMLVDESGKPSRVVGVNMDVTDRKRAEEAQRESEERFRLVANAAPVMIWMSGVDKEPTYFNQLWQDFTGLSETDLRKGLARIVHPDDYPQCHEVYCRGFDQRQPFTKECRLRRHDGEYRWMLDIGAPRFHKDGSFAGYIGSCVDVTDRKLAEEALSGMTRKLVEAQEQERARIARELHDDINQRVALLAVRLEQVRENNVDLPSEVLSTMQELQKQTTEISNDVQAISHDLHSSQLEYLGIVAGMKSWCKEFAERQKMEIDCRHDVRSTLPREIGLCLLRVLQEALHNAAKHSGVKRIEVQLREESGEIHLTVSDSGRGFDVEAVKQGKGLGLTSMRERVRLVNGTISVESKPLGGTTIHVRVPSASGHEAERATG
jgi:PAS domain S-box-containing protein